MTSKCFLLKTKPDEMEKVYSEVKKFSEVKNVNRLWGEYEILVIVEVRNLKSTIQAMKEKIGQIDGVTQIKVLPKIGS